MSKLDHAASLISSDAASTRKATLPQRTTKRKSTNTGCDALYLRWKVASLTGRPFALSVTADVDSLQLLNSGGRFHFALCGLRSAFIPVKLAKNVVSSVIVWIKINGV